MRVIERLWHYLHHKRVNAYTFEKECKVGSGYLKKQKVGKGSIGSDVLDRIHRSYPDLNMIWLLHGEGIMLTEPDEQELALQTLREDRHPYTKDEMIRFLTERVQLLETSLADKEKIIRMLEEKITNDLSNR